jgi:hypothetical protein
MLLVAFQITRTASTLTNQPYNDYYYIHLSRLLEITKAVRLSLTADVYAGINAGT